MKSKVDPFHFDTKQSLQSQPIEKEKTFNYQETFLNVCSLTVKEQRIVKVTVNQCTYQERLQWADTFNTNYRMYYGICLKKGGGDGHEIRYAIATFSRQLSSFRCNPNVRGGGCNKQQHLVFKLSFLTLD